MAGGHTVRFVLIGNPNRASGPFCDAFRNPLFNKIHVSAFDVPDVKERRQVVTGLATLEWLEEMAAKYGTDSDIYRVVYGNNTREIAGKAARYPMPCRRRRAERRESRRQQRFHDRVGV